MHLFENKIWSVEQRPDFLQLTFYGKYTEGLHMLTWALVGFEFVLLMLIGLITTMNDPIIFIVIVVLVMIGTGFIIRLNLKTASEKHYVIITRDRIKFIKTNGKKTIEKELDRSKVKEVRITNPAKLSEGVDIFLLLISPFLWFMVGAGMKDPNPVVCTEAEMVPFFEFGRINEKNAVISFLNHYLGTEKS